MSSLQELVVDSIEAFLAQSGESARQLGLDVANDHKLVPRARAGRITLRMADRLLAKILGTYPMSLPRAQGGHAAKNPELHATSGREDA